MIQARWLVALAAAAPALAAAQCEAPGAKVESDRVVVVYRTVPPKIAVGQHFTVEAHVCAKGAGPAPTALRVDADMPAHRHGMNYRASVAARGAGLYRAEGLLLHMPGRWRFIFDLALDGRIARVIREVDVP